MNEVKWKCDKCGEEFDEYSYAMIIDNVQVLETKDGKICASTTTGQHQEQLCFTCWSEKYGDEK